MIDVGQTVGNYNITDKLGEGGMGKVFLAQHPVIGSKVALKAIHPYYARSPEIVSRFVNEARAVNQIGHDHIIDIHDFGSTPEGDVYFIMEYLHGEMLSDKRGRQVAFAPARALNIVAQIADALAASHERGVIHRDLKPDNIFLITRDGRPDFVKVLDFGLAKLTHLSGAVPAYTTDAGMVMGTPYYMSPEQCEGRAELDHRTDVYSLGVILFEMLTGQVPFAGEGYGEVMTKHISLPPPAARRFVPNLPVALDAILSRALAKDPDARFQTMAEFREVLLSTESALSPPPAPAVERDLERDPSGPLSLSLGAATSRPTPPAFAFQQHVGEVGEAIETRPRRSHGLLFLGGAAVLVVVAMANGGLRRQAIQLFARSAAPTRPTTVRVNFSSDPAGATVSKSDGSVLGVTPLSVEIPYSDRPVDYRLHKDGYTSKVSSIVPNLPSPVFVLLERIGPLAPPPVAAASVVPEIAARPLTGADALPPARARAAREAQHRLSAERLRDLVDDGDDVMPPSTQ